MVKKNLAFIKRCIPQLPFFGFKGVLLTLKGFTPNKAVLYKKIDSTYLTDRYRYVVSSGFSEEHFKLFNDKFVNYLFLKQFTDKLASIIAYKSISGCTLLLDEKAYEYVGVISKPNNGWGGTGIVKYESLYEVNSGNVIVQPIISNIEYSKRIFEFSLNTIRVVTCVVNGEVELLATVHRFGSSKTGTVDNFSAGGISAKIDIDTGIITSAIQFDGVKRFDVDSHPDSGEKIVGVKVPNWSLMLDEIVKLHSKISFVAYVGWDVAITNDSFVIVEANHVSDIDLIQCHGGLLESSAARRFYLGK